MAAVTVASRAVKRAKSPMVKVPARIARAARSRVAPAPSAPSVQGDRSEEFGEHAVAQPGSAARVVERVEPRDDLSFRVGDLDRLHRAEHVAERPRDAAGRLARRLAIGGEARAGGLRHRDDQPQRQDDHQRERGERSITTTAARAGS